MTLYNVIDHKAPRWMPHKAELHTNTFLQFTINAISVGVVLLALSTTLLILVVLLLPVYINYSFYKWSHPIRGEALVDYDIKNIILGMRRMYYDNPPVQGELGILLDSVYACAGRADLIGARERYNLASKLVESAPKAADSELEALKIIVDQSVSNNRMISQELEKMRREGLL